MGCRPGLMAAVMAAQGRVERRGEPEQDRGEGAGVAEVGPDQRRGAVSDREQLPEQGHQARDVAGQGDPGPAEATGGGDGCGRWWVSRGARVEVGFDLRGGQGAIREPVIGQNTEGAPTGHTEET